MTLKDQNLLCALLFLCREKIYHWKRLKIAVYALSEGARNEGKEIEPIYSGKFENWCYYGPNDHELWRDLIALEFNDYIEFVIHKEPYETTSHSMYVLTEKGIAKAKAVLKSLDEKRLQELQRISQELMNEKNDATKFFTEYSQKWGEERLPIVQQILALVQQKLPDLQRLT